RSATARANKEAAEIARREAWLAGHPEVVELLAREDLDGCYAVDNLRFAVARYGNAFEYYITNAVDGVAKFEAARVEKAEREAKQAASKFVGTVGEKVVVEVTVKYVKAFPGYAYNSPDTMLVVMEDVEGNTIKTWNSGEFGRKVETGQKVA